MIAPGTLPLLLLVDDEREILIALTDLFEDRYRVIASPSPIEAIDLVAANPDIAVIISDQRMPEMTGSQFLARVRGASDAEAILLTGYADLSAVVVAINDGAISGYANKPWEAEALGAMVDAAAERFALRRALAFERSAFHSLAGGSHDRIAIIDGDGAVVRSIGCDRPSPVEARDRAALAADHADEEDRMDDDMADGERWTHVRRVPFGEPGRRHLLRIERDDTQRRMAARRRHQSDKLEALGTLAGGIAHDFNNLLAAILGNLELAEHRIDQPDRLARHLASAGEAARRGSAITRRLLSFSRQRDLAAEVFAADVAIRAVEDLIVRSAAGRVRLAFDFADPSWSIRTDPGQFELALVNLAINARDAMGGDGIVGIATRNIDDVAGQVAGLAGPHVRVSVSDTGSGIDEAVRRRVFEPFFTTKAQGIGTGLGLPMVRAMARSAGGDVSIDSEVGRGTTIHLWLPRAEAGPVAVPVAHAAARSRPLRLMVVEDDAQVRAVVVGHLEAAGHTLTVHPTAAAAIAELEAGARFDLLVTDHAMPRMSGIELAARAKIDWPEMPVLLITGFAEIGDTGVDLPVLTKPFSGAQLNAAITTLVGA